MSIACTILLAHGIGEAVAGITNFEGEAGITEDAKKIATYCLNCNRTVCEMDEQPTRRPRCNYRREEVTVQALKLLAMGKNKVQIAKELSVPEKTLRTYFRKYYEREGKK